MTLLFNLMTIRNLHVNMNRVLKSCIVLLFIPSLCYSYSMSNKDDIYNLPSTNNDEVSEKSAISFQAYQCNNPSEVTTISLLNVENCNLTREKVKTTKVKIELLQRLDYDEVEVYQCKVKVVRDVWICSLTWFSWTPAFHLGIFYDKMDIFKCQELHEKGQYEYRKGFTVKGKINTTINNYLHLAGKHEHVCYGAAEYSDPLGSYKGGVVAVANVYVTISTMKVKIHRSTNQIFLPSQTCEYSKGECTEDTSGYTYWKTINKKECETWGSLAKVEADKIEGNEKTIYSFESNKISFALTVTKQIPICGTVLQQTEHPRLIIHELINGSEIGKPIQLAEQIDMTAYINAKFLYFDYNLKKNTDSLYYNIIQKTCELKKKMLENKLTIARISPDRFAIDLKGSLGYSGILSGEVIYIVKCVPVEVKFRQTDKCYAELPVSMNDQNLFMNPITHILQPHGIEITCSDVLSNGFNINDKWYAVGKQIAVMDKLIPVTLGSSIKPSWVYNSSHYLASSGIYTNEQLDKARARLMDGYYVPPLMHKVVDVITGSTTFDSSINLSILNKRIGKNFTNILYYMFVQIGTFLAGLYGIFIILAIVRALLQTFCG